MATTESQPRTRYPHSPPAPGPSATVADAAASALPPTPVSAGSPGRRRGLNRSAGAKYLSVFNIAMLTTVTVTSLRSLPTMATYGLGAVTLFVVPAVFFLLPAALVGAELAGGWKGGVYVWVRQAFSDRLGFVAIWLQWIQNVVWYPVQLAFIAGSLAFMIGLPSLSNSGVFTAVVILTLYWTATVVTLRGGNLFAKLSSWGGVIGTLIPAALLIVLGCLWLADGLPSQIPLAAGDVIPPFTGIASIVLVVSNVLSFGGMEVNAVHADQMRDPRRGYTKAVMVAFGLILGVTVLPTIAVALVVPNAQLGFTNGVNLAFGAYFGHLHIDWATYVLSGAIALGAMASVISWVAGPSKGLAAAASTGLLPRWLQQRNEHGVQESILAVQGVIVSLLALLFVFTPNVSNALIVLVDVAAALYLVMYLLMFASVVVLRRKQPSAERVYRVKAVRLVAGTGFVASLAALIMAFVPPAGHSAFPPWAYPWLVGLAVVLLGSPPLLFYHFRKPAWVGPAADHSPPPVR